MVSFSKEGFTRQEAIQNLKIEAFKRYGSLAHGITNLALVKKSKVFYYTKARRNISTPKEPENYERASAEVVRWK